MSVTDKLLPVLVGISGTAASWWSNDTTTPVLGVPATTVVAGAVGALIALAYDPHTKDRPNGKRYAQAAGAGVTGATLSGLAPAYGAWTWSAGLQGALAFLFAIAVYFLLPMGIQLLPELRDAAARFIQTSRLSDWLPFLKRRPAPELPVPPPKDEPQ